MVNQQLPSMLQNAAPAVSLQEQVFAHIILDSPWTPTDKVGEEREMFGKHFASDVVWTFHTPSSSRCDMN